MKYILVLCLMLLAPACASRGIPDRIILIESHTEPLELEADAGPPSCTVSATLNGTQVILRSWAGCFVIRREIRVPEYDNAGVFHP